MNLNELNNMIKKVINESTKQELIDRIYNISNNIGTTTTLDEVIKRIDDDVLSKILDQIELEYDLKKEIPQVQSNNIENPEGQANFLSSLTEPSQPHPIQEKHLTGAEQDKKEEIVTAMKSTKDKVADLKKRYGNKWKDVVYAIATKKAKELAEVKTNSMNGFTTLVKNGMGHIHMWKGKKQPVQISKYNFTVNGEDSDVYFQSEDDIETIKGYLTSKQIHDLENGWTVITSKIPSDYFQNEPIGHIVAEDKLPGKGTPGWHQLQIAKKTLGYSDAGAAIMGGMTKEEAQKIVDKYKKSTNENELNGWDASSEEKRSSFSAVEDNFFNSFKDKVKNELINQKAPDKLLEIFDYSVKNNTSKISMLLNTRFNLINNQNLMDSEAKKTAAILINAFVGTTQNKKEV